MSKFNNFLMKNNCMLKKLYYENTGRSASYYVI